MDFDVVESPATVAEAITALGQDESTTTERRANLDPTLKHGWRCRLVLVFVSGIEEMRGVRMGVMANCHWWRDVCTAVGSQGSTGAFTPGLAGLAARIGDRAVRNRGTIAGPVAKQDFRPVSGSRSRERRGLWLLTARERRPKRFSLRDVRTRWTGGRSEIVTEVRFSIPEKAHYEKFIQPASRFP